MLFRLSFARVIGVALFALWSQPAFAQKPQVDPQLDLTKNKRIERPAQELVNHAAQLKALKELNQPREAESEAVIYSRMTAIRAGAAGGGNAIAKRLDKTKFAVVEGVGEEFLANSAPAATVPSPMKPVDAKDNPIVKPGEVKWHATLAAAVEASKNSHKPVLLLHMMGQLDKQFC
jgi:hypothetical protein